MLYQQSDLPYMKKLIKLFEPVDETYANTMWTLANVLLSGLVGKLDQLCISGSPPKNVCFHVMCVMLCVCIKGDGLQYVKVNKYICIIYISIHIVHLKKQTICIDIVCLKKLPVLGRCSDHQNYFYLLNDRVIRWRMVLLLSSA